MSLLMLTVMLVGMPGSASLQAQPEVAAVKFSWHKLHGPNAPSARKDQQMRIDQLNSMIGMEMQKDPKDQDLGAIARLREEQQRIEQNHVTIDSFNHSNKAYEYKFRFKNHGKKQVAALVWLYVFIDPVSGKELERLRFGSKVHMGAGREGGLTAYSDSGPPMLVNAEAAKKTGTAWKETVIIQKIEFSDGSKWEQTGS